MTMFEFLLGILVVLFEFARVQNNVHRIGCVCV